MNTKLTLTLDDVVIKHAKEYAKNKGRSLSDLIESYLKLLVKDDVEQTTHTPIVNKLRGSFKMPDNFDYKKMLQEELSKKYG